MKNFFAYCLANFYAISACCQASHIFSIFQSPVPYQLARCVSKYISFPVIGMNKAKCFCMQCLSRANGKTIIYKLFVFGVNSSFYNFIATIKIIIEQRMADIFHMHPDLVGAAGFQYTFYQCYITKSFHYFIMGDGFFSMVTFRIGFK